MTTKTRVINDTYLKIDKNIKHRGIYKGEEGNEKESARKDRVQVFAECLYSLGNVRAKHEGVRRAYQCVKLTRCAP